MPARQTPDGGERVASAVLQARNYRQARVASLAYPIVVISRPHSRTACHRQSWGEMLPAPSYSHPSATANAINQPHPASNILLDYLCLTARVPRMLKRAILGGKE